MKKIFFVSFLIIFTRLAVSQSNVLLDFPNKDSLSSKTLFFNFENLWFVKNNEYFNFIADGYTLFGDKLQAGLRYRPNRRFEISGGFETLKYFGQDTLDYFLPDIRMTIFSGKHRWVFGRLITTDNHKMPVQLYDFERLLDKRSYEYGFEHRYFGKNFSSDIWLEWQNFIKKASNVRERLNFGASLHYDWVVNAKNHLETSVFAYIHHRGGQINLRQPQDSLNNALVLLNTAASAAYVYHLSGERKLSFGLQFFQHHLNTDNTEEFHFKTGNAWLGFVRWQQKSLQAVLSYWKSKAFVSVAGDAMYQSYSTRIDKYLDEQGEALPVFINYSEAEREMLTAGISYRYKLFKNVLIAAHFKGFWQLNTAEINLPYYQNRISSPHFDYNFGLYVLYRIDGYSLKKL